MSDYQTHIQVIQRVYPQLTVTAVIPVPLEEGQYNLVLRVNDDLIFRFPRYPAAIEQLALESKILKAIQPYVSVQVPDPIYLHLHTAVVGEAFMGYRQIPGEPLWLPRFRAIRDEAVLSRLGQQIARFLRELHHIPIADLVDEDVPVCDTREEWADIYGRVQAKLFPYMRLDACRSVAQHFEQYLDGAGFSYQPCLRHGDFGTGNILYNARGHCLQGVIDFDFTTLGDPAIDFAGLLTFGEPFVRRMNQTYPELEGYWNRIWFYKGTFALLEALFGVENGDKAAFQSGIAGYV